MYAVLPQISTESEEEFDHSKGEAVTNSQDESRDDVTKGTSVQQQTTSGALPDIPDDRQQVAVKTAWRFSEEPVFEKVPLETLQAVFTSDDVTDRLYRGCLQDLPPLIAAEVRLLVQTPLTGTQVSWFFCENTMPECNVNVSGVHGGCIQLFMLNKN